MLFLLLKFLLGILKKNILTHLLCFEWRTHRDFMMSQFSPHNMVVNANPAMLFQLLYYLFVLGL